MTTRQDAILNFWFGPLPDPETCDEEKARSWFMGGAAMDEVITAQFRDDVLAAAAGEYDSWSTPEGKLARILLFDQFSRNIWRGDARAFAYDASARELARELTSTGAYKTLHHVQRAFVFFPFEHSESLEDQDRSVALFDELRQEAPAPLANMSEGYYTYALKHRDIIVEFGRYPHRNVTLGRESTEEELAYMSDGGETFGQKK